MDKIDLDELERLAAQATPGPWVVAHLRTNANFVFAQAPDCDMVFHAREEDVQYITEACNAVPELIARMRELERQRELLARNLAEAPWCLACQIKICSNGGKDIDPLLVDRNECKNVLIRWAEQAAKEATSHEYKLHL